MILLSLYMGDLNYSFYNRVIKAVTILLWSIKVRYPS